jgi:membrane protein
MTFFKQAIWLIAEDQTRHFFIKCLRLLLLAIQGFNQDLCLLRASALTLYSLLSVVPMIAMLFGIAKGFGFEQNLKQQLLQQIPEQDTMILRLIQFAENMLANTEGGIIAGIGIMVLFWTVIRVIGNIEESFNHIWKIKKNREFSRKLSDYLSLMLLAPVLLIAASSITVFITTQITGWIKKTPLPEDSMAILLSILNYSPIIIMSILFSFIFIFIPNQKVDFKAGIIAGIVTGIFYQLIQLSYLELQIGVSNYNAIYGSFTALPLFIIWLQLGWLMVLFGCEICFFIQHYDVYKHNENFLLLSFRLKKFIALRIMQLIIHQFIHAENAFNAKQIALTLSLPIVVIQSSLNTLIACRLIVQLNVIEQGEILFQPAQDVHRLTVYDVIDALEKQGENTLPNMKSFAQLSTINQLFDQKIKAATENCLLKEL